MANESNSALQQKKRRLHLPQVAKGELLPVPVEMVPQFWRNAKCLIHGPKNGIGRDRGYDIERLHGRLLLGMDRLWMAVITEGSRSYTSRFAGVVITSIGPPPTDLPGKMFSKEQSLTVHFISGIHTLAWANDAIEKIIAYGKENNCRQLFMLGRVGWLVNYGRRFYGHFDRVGLARDRMRANPRYNPAGRHYSSTRVGHFRLLVPLPPGMSWEVGRRSRRRAYFREEKVYGDRSANVGETSAVA